MKSYTYLSLTTLICVLILISNTLCNKSIANNLNNSENQNESELEASKN